MALETWKVPFKIAAQRVTYLQDPARWAVQYARDLNCAALDLWPSRESLIMLREAHGVLREAIERDSSDDRARHDLVRCLLNYSQMTASGCAGGADDLADGLEASRTAVAIQGEWFSLVAASPFDDVRAAVPFARSVHVSSLLTLARVCLACGLDAEARCALAGARATMSQGETTEDWDEVASTVGRDFRPLQVAGGPRQDGVRMWLWIGF